MVRKLGEQIGYGNMMHLASECWQEMLIEKYGSPVGAFTVGKPIGANTAEEESVDIGFNRVKEFAMAADKWKYLENQIAMQKIEVFIDENCHLLTQSEHDILGLVKDWLQEEA